MLDYGQYAGNTTGACFWLCLAAGLAECKMDVLGQALPAGHPAHQLVEELRMHNIEDRALRATPSSVLGRLAVSLRQYFCSGPTPVLMRADVKDKIYKAFASLPSGGVQRTEELYERLGSKASV